MKIVHVIPIARGISREVLTYWSSESTPQGSVIRVPLRNKNVPGIVLKEEDAAEVKLAVRASQFNIKKVAPQSTIPLFSPAFMAAAQTTASYAGTTTGAVLASVLPNALLNNIDRIKFKDGRWETKQTALAAPEELIFQAEEKDRIVRYKSLIRESFARNESLYLCVPTIIDAERKYEELSRGIEEFTYILHSSLTKKETTARIQQLFKTDHPILIIGTPTFIALERPDIKTIIIERENSRAYKQPSRPYLDMRFFIRSYAEARKARLILGGLPLRIETLWRYEIENVSELTKPTFRLLSGPPSAIVDMRENQKLPGKTFRLLSDELKQMIEHASTEGGRVLLFVARRGLAPITICQDCGSTVKTTEGNAPMVLHRGPKGNIFVSHITGEVRDANERCKNCGSWRLEAMGIGIERIDDELEKLFPKIKRFRVDKESTSTHTQIKNEVAKFYATPGSILLATERVLAYLEEPIEHSGVVSIDSLLSLPEWKITERTFSLLLKLREITTKSYLVQTRKADQGIIEEALKGNVMDFYRNEIALRKALGYPPFSVLIKCSVIGTMPRGTALMEELLARLQEFGIEPYPAPLYVGKSKYLFHALIRLPGTEWPNEKLLTALAGLPPHVAIDVNPENLI